MKSDHRALGESFVSFVRPYWALARFNKPIGGWLLWIPCIWGILAAPGASAWTRLKLIMLMGVGSFVMRGAGCVINDMWDRDIDKRVARTTSRPIASGRVRMYQAWIFLVILLVIGLSVLVNLNIYAWLCCAAVIPLVIIYPLAKRFIWCPQLILGMAFGSGSVIGYVATGFCIDDVALWLYLASILWILGFDTIYGFQDIEDDRKTGVKSFSQIVAPYPRLVIGSVYACASFALVMAGVCDHIGWLFYPLWCAATFTLICQAYRMRSDDPAFCLSQFLMNKYIGLFFALAFAMGLVTQ